jgi:cytoskeletal protein CcmA (bactofilin family)
MLKKRTNGASEQPVPVITPDPVSAETKTIIGEHITIEGVIRGNGNLVIEGSVKGNIELEKHQLSVGPKGKVDAEIHAGNIVVAGRVHGNIKALGRVKITKDADFSGEIKAKGISIEDGAYLKAVIELERDDAAKGPSSMRPGDQTATAPGRGPEGVPTGTGKGN